MGGEGGEGNCLVYCKYVRTYVHMYDTIGPILGHAHSSWHMHYTCYSLNVYTWGECLPLQYALKCDGRANSGLVWLKLESIYAY